MLLSELAQKELIQVDDGVRYGLLAETDLLFDGKTGAIIGFEVKKQGNRFSLKKRHEPSEEFIPWSEIVLVGEHRILFRRTASIHGVNMDD